MESEDYVLEAEPEDHGVHMYYKDWRITRTGYFEFDVFQLFNPHIRHSFASVSLIDALAGINNGYQGIPLEHSVLGILLEGE